MSSEENMDTSNAENIADPAVEAPTEVSLRKCFKNLLLMIQSLS